VLPVDAKSGTQGSGGFVDAVSRNQHDWGTTLDRRGKLSVFGQQDPILLGRALGDCSVGTASISYFAYVRLERR
jgi:hypothetical protein